MTLRALFALGLIVLLASGLAAQAGTIALPAGSTPVFSDNFNDYANDAQFKAVWCDAPNPAVTWTPDWGGGSVVNSGGNVAQKNFTAVSLSDAAPVHLEFDYWDYSTGSGDRNTVGVRSASALFEFGEYGSMDPDPAVEGNTTVQGYGFRTVYVGGPSQVNPPSQGWIALTQNKVTSTDSHLAAHHFNIEIGSSYLTARLILANGAVYSRTVSLTSTAGDTLDNVRIGGPSSVSSTGTCLIDNVQLYTTPEPASLCLLALGGLLLRRRTA